MRNTDLTHNCERELELWIDNDEFFALEWRKTLCTGDLSYIKDAFDMSGFKYRDDQWSHLIDVFECEMTALEEALVERNSA